MIRATTIAAMLAALLAADSASAADRKAILDIDLNNLTSETQATFSSGSGLDLVWWIPIEFWEANLRQDGALPDPQIDEMLSVLGEYFVVAVVQADISSFGAFNYYASDQVYDGLTVEAIDAGGDAVEISTVDTIAPDMMIFLQAMQPILAQAMGNLGENFHFFTYPALDADGERLPSPFEPGRIRVTVSRADTSVPLDIETPIDSMFIPRICPNGKPAHVSWSYCPWSGKELD